MKKTITTLALACLALPAFAELSFDGYEVSPEEGNVINLHAITVTFPETAEIDINSSDDIVFTYEGIDVEVVKKAEGNALSVTLPEEVSYSGEYVLTIAAGALCGYDADYNSIDNPTPIELTWTIAGGGTVDFSNTPDPAEGTVKELSVINVTFDNAYEIEIDSKEDIVLTYNGSDVACTKKVSNKNTVTVTLAEPATAPGEYILTLGAYSMTAYDESYSEFPSNEEPIELKWTIAAAAGELDYSYTVSPKSGEVLISVPDVTFTFGAIDEVTADAAKAVVKLGEDLLSGYTVAAGAAANQLKVSFAEPVELADGYKTLSLTFPAGSLSGKKGATEAANKTDVEASYTVSAPVVYDLEAVLSRPTNPNADGEISADKQLDAFYFSAPAKGLVPADGEAVNVEIREVNGDYKVTGHLAKAFGLDQNLSYFSVNTGKEPEYNGDYEVVISRGAFGDSIWQMNPEAGHSNEQTVLRFKLVDGKDRESVGVEEIGTESSETTIHTLDGVRVESPLDALPAGLYIVNGRKVLVK